MFLTGIEELRKIEWRTTYLWDIQFPDAPAPFNRWFPAIDVEEPVFEIEEHTIEGQLRDYSVPKGYKQKDLKITFHDNIDSVLLDWLHDWFWKEMFNNGKAVTPLNDCVKKLFIKKMDRQRNDIKLTPYWVYPTGSLVDLLDNQSTASRYPLVFKIARGRYK